MKVPARLALTSVAVLILAACGGSASSQTPSSAAAPSASSAPSASTAPSGSAAAGGDQLHVGMRDFTFALDKSSLPPAPAAVAVTADNGGEAPHTITFYADDGYTQKVAGGDSGTVAPGASKDFSFTPPDGATVLFFRCEIHPTQMTGQITVGG